MYSFHAAFSHLPNAPFAGLVALLNFPMVSTLGWHLACPDEDSCSSQPEDSSGDHKGEMHARDERLLIAYQRSQDRDPSDPTNLPAYTWWMGAIVPAVGASPSRQCCRHSARRDRSQGETGTMGR